MGCVIILQAQQENKENRIINIFHLFIDLEVYTAIKTLVGMTEGILIGGLGS